MRFWVTQRLLRAPVPLTGDRALRPDTPWQRDTWMPAFLSCAGRRGGRRARSAGRHGARLARRPPRRGRPPPQLPRRRRGGLLAATPLLSATSLAAGLGMAVKNATQLLDDFCAAGIAVEVTHRSKRRLFGLTGLAPLRDVVRPPYRPEPGRGRGRPRLTPPPDGRAATAALAPLTPFDRRQFDYSDLAHWMTQMEQTIRQRAAHPRRSDVPRPLATGARRIARVGALPRRAGITSAGPQRIDPPTTGDRTTVSRIARWNASG